MNQEEHILAEQFSINLNLNGDEESFREENESDEEHIDEDEDTDEEDEEFSFSLAFDGVINESQITAEEAFSNGCIKPVYPLFNQDLLLEEKLNTSELSNLKKVFVPATASTSGNDEDISGPYCDWDSKLVGTTTCKKSNSTGFSKIWRFKDFRHRSSSDGKDAFVFLNNTSSPTGTTVSRRKEKIVNKNEKEKKKELTGSKVNGEEGKAMVVGDSKTKVKGKKVIKSNTAPSPHEVYLKSKAKAEQRRRSYHIYRPEVVGLFTNITGGGLTRNVHPF